MTRVALIGTGLIGASVGLALLRRPDEWEVIGWDSDSAALSLARQRGAVTRAAGSLAEAVAGVDVVLLATPLDRLLIAMQELTPHLDAAAAVTDVAGVKEPVVALGKQLLGARFVGGHPLAGGATQGPAEARADLFEKACWAICPTSVSAQEAVAHVERLIAACGAVPLRVDAAEHDRAVAWISHLPQLLALELLAGVERRGGAEAVAGRLAAGGFRDLTRIGSSPAEIWLPVLDMNRDAIAGALEEFAAAVERAAGAVRRGESLEADFLRGQRLRAELDRRAGGRLK